MAPSRSGRAILGILATGDDDFSVGHIYIYMCVYMLAEGHSGAWVFIGPPYLFLWLIKRAYRTSVDRFYDERNIFRILGRA